MRRITNPQIKVDDNGKSREYCEYKFQTLFNKYYEVKNEVFSEGPNRIEKTKNRNFFNETIIKWNDNRDAWWHEEMEIVEPRCYPVWMGAEDPLFILYTRYI